MEQHGNKRIYMTAETIMKYLNGDEKLHTLITARNTEFDLITSDQSLYEAFGSIKDRKGFNINLLIKLLEVTTIVSFSYNMGFERKILTDERAEELRNKIGAMDTR